MNYGCGFCERDGFSINDRKKRVREQEEKEESKNREGRKEKREEGRRIITDMIIL